MDFKADNLFADYDENDILIIAFSGKIKNEDAYLIIQDAYDRNDEQEIELGMNTFYIEINDQSTSGYGGIKEIKLYKNLLSINLDKTGMANLNLENNKIEIELELDENKFENLTEKLALIFKHEQKVKTTYNTVYKT